MTQLNSGSYDAVRYAPNINSNRPFQIIASTYSEEGTFRTDMSYDEAADLVKSLSLLLIVEANKDG